MIDNFRHKGLRKNLVAELQELGISNHSVLSAIDNIPRHWFLDSAFADIAYQNRALPIGSEQTISHPYTVAFQSSLLNVEKGMQVLEIGTGSGYQTLVLEQLQAKVYSVERQKLLFDKTKALLKKFKSTAYLVYGDGYKGIPGFAPYDRIIVTCGAPFVPTALLKQLKVGGKLIIPVDCVEGQEMKEINRVSESNFEEINHGKFAFVPMLESREKKR
jgi:protein-L-isoaspartate(D-aspartate) O-methyltransferase